MQTFNLRKMTQQVLFVGNSVDDLQAVYSLVLLLFGPKLHEIFFSSDAVLKASSHVAI